jgi:ABC-type sugar transport system ATPase subunit
MVANDLSVDARPIVNMSGEARALHEAGFAISAGELVRLLGNNRASNNTLTSVHPAVIRLDRKLRIMRGAEEAPCRTGLA